MDSLHYWNSRRMSRRSVVRAAALGGAGLAGAALIGCGDDGGDPASPTGTTAAGMPTSGPSNGTATGTPSASGEPRQGGRFGIGRGAVSANFNVVTNANEGNQYSSLHAYDRLISPRLDDRIYVLEAAESIETPDEVTVVAKLREGLVYQDRPPVNGRAVSAEDIVVMQEYVRDEDAAIFGSFAKDSLESAEAQDERTVVFHLRQPNAYLFSGTQLGHPADQCIIPRELVEGDLDQSEPIGSGPYQLKEYQFQVRYLYERNPTYRRASEGLPYIDERELISLTDTAALEAAFRSEQTHLWLPPAESADRIINDLGDDLEVVEALGLSPVVWNMSSNREWTQDVRLREAFYRAFNAEEFINLSADGWAVEVPGQLAAGLERYQLDPAQTEEYRRYDEAAARQLLDAAGFDFSQTYIVTSIEGGVNATNCQILAEQLRRVGVETTIELRPAAEWFEIFSGTGNYDFSPVGHPAYDTPQTPLRLHHTETRNINAWTNIRDPEIDAMIEATETTLDPEAQVELVKDTQLALFERYAHLNSIYSNVQREIRYAYVRDWELNISNQPMYRVEAWMDV